ncbi:MAG: tRNA 2-thiouridine(34) synthase MnmA [Candidatus Cryptobacteroides sp.]
MKICIGLSGGVDSSVAALLLKQQGHDVFAMFMQNWHDTEGTLHGDCEWEEDRFVAEMVARKIGIPFYFIDLSKEYRQRVVDYMFDEYSKGRTPNPDVLCNREIKFAAFLEAAVKLGADMVATGHYCRKDIARDADGNEIMSGGKPVYKLIAGVDPNKDQSYFLCQLTQEQLSKAVFPIGDLLKNEVRQIAKEADLPSAEKKDSQGICFVGKVDLPVFLQQKLKSVEGDVIEVFDAFYENNAQYNYIRNTLNSILDDDWVGEVSLISDYISDDKAARSESGDYEGGCRFSSIYSFDKISALSDSQLFQLSQPVTYESLEFETETYRSGRRHIRKTRYKANPYGAVAGRHEGAQFYTIGQRKGLNIGGHKDSLFVISTDIERNIIYVGEGHRHRGLSRSCLRIAPDEIHWLREDCRMRTGEIRRYRVRIRYRQPLQDAVLVMRDNGLYIIFDEPQRGITPGQFAVWYDHDELIGSGVI